MKTEGRKILIERYLSGDLSNSEQVEFERIRLNDKELDRELRFQEELMEAIRDEKKMYLRKTLNNIHKKSIKTFTLPAVALSWKVQSIAATLLVVLMIGGGILLNNVFESPTNHELYETYFNPESSLLNVRSASSNYTSVELGMKYFEQENYNKAIEVFQLDADNLMGKLYTAYSLMHLEEFEQAEMEFDAILLDNDNLFIDQAEWNLGLCYMVSGNAEKADELFSKIASGNTVYNKRALELLTELGRN